jgi:hypothetical protein
MMMMMMMIVMMMMMVMVNAMLLLDISSYNYSFCIESTHHTASVTVQSMMSYVTIVLSRLALRNVR